MFVELALWFAGELCIILFLPSLFRPKLHLWPATLALYYYYVLYIRLVIQVLTSNGSSRFLLCVRIGNWLGPESTSSSRTR